MDHTVLPAITPMSAWRLPRLRLRTSKCSLLLICLLQKDERLSRPGWLTYSGRFTHISGHPSAACRSSAGQRKFAGQRPTFYHCTTQPTLDHAKRSSHRTANSIFGKIERIASEEVALQMIKSKCVRLIVCPRSMCSQRIPDRFAWLCRKSIFYETFHGNC